MNLVNGSAMTSGDCFRLEIDKLDQDKLNVTSDIEIKNILLDIKTQF